jgi:hypothetical protein
MGGRHELLQILDGDQFLFLAVDDLVFNLLRCRATVDGFDRDLGTLHCGRHLDRQAREREHAKQ